MTINNSEAPIIHDGDIIISHCKKHRRSTEHVWGKWREHGRRLWCVICWPSKDPREDKSFTVECGECGTEHTLKESSKVFTCGICDSVWEIVEE